MGWSASSKTPVSLPLIPKILLKYQLTIPKAVAQGIIAQVRVLGGSIGIAASTAILGSTFRRLLREQGELLGLPGTPSAADTPAAKTSAALSLLRRTNAGAFKESMQVCSALTGLGVLATTLVWRKERIGYVERRREQIENDQEFRRVERERDATGV